MIHLDSVLGWFFLTLAIGVLVWLTAALKRGDLFHWSRAKTPLMFWLGFGCLLFSEVMLASRTVLNFAGAAGH